MDLPARYMDHSAAFLWIISLWPVRMLYLFGAIKITPKNANLYLKPFHITRFREKREAKWICPCTLPLKSHRTISFTSQVIQGNSNVVKYILGELTPVRRNWGGRLARTAWWFDRGGCNSKYCMFFSVDFAPSKLITLWQALILQIIGNNIKTEGLHDAPRNWMITNVTKWRIYLIQTPWSKEGSYVLSYGLYFLDRDPSAASQIP